MFSSDGRFVLTGGNDGAIQAWPTSVDDLIDLARERVAGLQVEPGRSLADRTVDQAVAERDAVRLNRIAWRIVDTAAAINKRNLVLALRAAEKAVELTQEKNGNMLDTLARVWFWKRDHKQAIALQGKAVEAAELDPSTGNVVKLRQVLEEYQRLVASTDKR